MFSISRKFRNSDVSDFWKLRTPMFFVISHVLGSNNPNTIPDPTQVRCSCSHIIFYVSIRTLLCFGLSYIYVSSGLRDFPVTSLVTL